MLLTMTSYFTETINYRPRKRTKTKDEPPSQVFYMRRTVTPMQALESLWGQIDPFSNLNIHISEKPVLLVFQSAARHFTLDIYQKHLVIFQISKAWQSYTNTLPRHRVNTQDSNYEIILMGVRNTPREIFDPLHRLITVQGEP